MRHGWRANSIEPDNRSGTGMLEFDTGTVLVEMDDFGKFFRMVSLIEREINNAHICGRREVCAEVQRIKP